MVFPAPDALFRANDYVCKKDMQKGMLREASPSSHFFLVLLLVLACWIFFQAFGLISSMAFWGLSWKEVLQLVGNTENTQSIAILKYIQAVTSLGMFIAPALGAAWLISGNASEYTGLKIRPPVKNIFLVLILSLAIMPATNLLSYLNTSVELPADWSALTEALQLQEKKMEEIMERFLDVRGIGPLLINILVIAVIPALAEEFLFRGVFQKILIHWTRSVHAGVFLTSLIFGLMHFQFLTVLPRIALGMVLGYLFVWSRSLWIPVWMHFVNNASGVIFYYLYYSGRTAGHMEEIGTPGHFIAIGILSVFVSLALLWLIRRISLLSYPESGQPGQIDAG